MCDVTDFFNELSDEFTVYVCEQKFVAGRGAEYFKSFRGKSNYISTERDVVSMITRVGRAIGDRIPAASALVEMITTGGDVDIPLLVTSLGKLFMLHDYQAAGPEVIDPIIIQEGEVTKRHLAHLVNLHRDSVLRPTIIILLKDNDFERARGLLSKCPNGTNVKLIRNSGKTVFYKVVNAGAENADEFIDAYSRQCFSTCSSTERSVLLGAEWNENRLVNDHALKVFKVRSSLLCDEKDAVKGDIVALINQVQSSEAKCTADAAVQSGIECILRLYRVFSNDAAGGDLDRALFLANDLDNDLLRAHVFRYSHFTNCSRVEKKELLGQAEDIFRSQSVEDHALYCKNNSLIHDFSEGRLQPALFIDMLDEAIHNIPGLVGMSHIFNNVGVAHIFSGNPSEAIRTLSEGVAYAGSQRVVQRLAIETNRAIARSYSFELIEENEIELLINSVIDGMQMTGLPFIASNFLMNLVAITLRQNTSKARDFFVRYRVGEFIQNGLNVNIMGSGSLHAQLVAINARYGNVIPELDLIKFPSRITTVSGIRLDFINRTCLNPFFFNIWL